jgi:putative salt-induced outer membrane protein YdiY
MKKVNYNFIICLTIIVLFNCLTQAQINTEKLRKEPIQPGFSGNAGMEFGLNAGNSNYLSLDGNLRLDYLINNLDFFLVSNYEYKEGNDQKILDQGFTHLRCDIALSQKTFLEFFTQKEFNDFISLKDRNLAGSGFRINILNKTSKSKNASTINIFLGVGAMFENEVYSNQPVKITKNLIRSTNYLDFYWQPDTLIKFSLVNYFQPYAGSIKNYRWLADAKLNFSISRSFSFVTHFTLRYDNQPVTKIKKYDLELTNGITVQF